MKEVRALLSYRLAALFALVVGLALCTNRLFGIHGVESALVLGALIPPWAAVVGARIATQARRTQTTVTATELLWRALSSAWTILAIPIALLALNSLRVRNCDPVQGALFIILGPFSATTLAAIWGVVIATVPSHVRVGTTLAVLGPFVSIGAALWRFHATPAIFAYGHFFGYFPGTLYDEALQIPGPLLTLRVFTLLFSVGMSCLFVGHYDPSAHRIRARPQRSVLFGLSAMLCLGLTFAAETSADSLGHESHTEWITQRLGRSLDGSRCRVVVPRELNVEEAERLRDDCDFRVEQMERVIGVTQRARVTAFFFRSPDEKRALMGAATTYIAKPWRNEVYLQLSSWPHPVLAHEIAHVVAGNLAPGPFRVAAGLNGLWPEASLIEGMAVAAAWDADGGLTPHQWARAMIELGVAPRIRDLLGTGFLGQPKERAYTVAGSFLRFLADTEGWRVVREIYRTGRVEHAGATLDHLEVQWSTFVRKVPLPDAARALAAQRFSRGSIFSNVCPHQVANLRLLVQGDLAANDIATAIESCRNLLSVDPADTWARTTLLSAYARTGRTKDAERELQTLIGPPTAPEPTLWAARHAIADAAWRRGELLAAQKLYRELLREPQSEDVTRLLEVKILALQSTAEQTDLLFELLVGRAGIGPDPATATHLAHELSRWRSDGLGNYLEARQLFFAQRFAESARLMDNARTRGLPTKLLRIAALRIEAISRFALGEPNKSALLWREFAQLGGSVHAFESNDWLQRVRWFEREAPSP